MVVGDVPGSAPTGEEGGGLGACGGGGEAGPGTAASLVCVLRGSRRNSGVSAFMCPVCVWGLTAVWGKEVFKAPNPNYGGGRN